MTSDTTGLTEGATSEQRTERAETVDETAEKIWSHLLASFGWGNAPKPTDSVDPVLVEGLSRLSATKADWLKELYIRRSESFKLENDRIWDIGRILLPISLGTFGLLAPLQTPTVLQVLLLGGTSIVLLWTWNAIAETHRRFQEGHKVWLDAIEQVLRLGTTKSKEPAQPEGATTSRPPSGSLSFRAIRYGLLRAVVLAWIVILLHRVWRSS